MTPSGWIPKSEDVVFGVFATLRTYGCGGGLVVSGGGIPAVTHRTKRAAAKDAVARLSHPLGVGVAAISGGRGPKVVLFDEGDRIEVATLFD